MAAEPLLMTEPASGSLPASPSFSADNRPVNTDSMVSIRLSEPPSPMPVDHAAASPISLETVKSPDSVLSMDSAMSAESTHSASSSESAESAESAESSSTTGSDATIEPSFHQRTSSLPNASGVDLDTEINGPQDEDEVEYEDVDESEEAIVESALEAAPLSNSQPPTPFDDTLLEVASNRRHSTTSSASDDSVDSNPVDWEELERTEEAVPQDEVSDEQTAFLLARLEQENNALATNPRVALLKKRESASSKGSKSPRPPSIQVLKKLVQDPSGAPSRYSLLPTPPPMTELEFWSALVKDYPQTAQRLPTLTANKIKGGVPPPLRGVVWVSMVGARDPHLSDEFDRFEFEDSPYDTMIGKDIGRSFPGVEMFKEAGGEGQSMLGKVLKVFSLYDEEIGYCQGLGFLVGPLLMQMGEKDAFCVLVKLMEKYDLRACFMPDLGGLHLRIYQFQSLLDSHMPELAKHLKSLSVEAAYLSQWFLSFFAVTCPLPMLFRIYDVIFAEGASETIMRVAMSLMKQNEKKLMEITEFEEVMQLLLGRLLWEPYNGSADDLVNDFVGLTGIVTHESLQKLEKAFKEAKENSDHVAAPRPGFFQDVSLGASRFLGRLWTSHGPTKSQVSLTPPANANGKAGLRRSASKQSIAASETSMHGSSESSSNSVSTAATETTAVTRDSSGDALPSTRAGKGKSLHVPTPSTSKEDRDLHGQIEDLLTALSETQRDSTLLASQIEKQNEERDEDHRMLRELIAHITETSKRRTAIKTPSKTSTKEERRVTSPSLPSWSTQAPTPTETPQASSGDAEPAETIEVPEADDSVETAEPAEPAELIESVEPIELVESDETVEPAEPTEAADAVEPPEPIEPIDSEQADDSPPEPMIVPAKEQFASTEEDQLIERAEARLKAHRDVRGSVVMETKQRLRQSLMRSKDQLGVEITRATEFEHRITVQQRELESLRDQLSHARNRIQDDLVERRKMEKQLSNLRTTNNRNSVASNASESSDVPSIWRSESWGSKRASLISSGGSPTTPNSAGGLRELKLGKGRNLDVAQMKSPTAASLMAADAAPLKSPVAALKSPASSNIPARGSSLATRKVLATEDHKPATEDAMLVELVAAKTSEAVARQELEEVKGRMEALRKMLSLPGAPSRISEADKSLGHKLTASEANALQAGAGATESQSNAQKTPAKDTKAKETTLSPPASSTSTWFPWPRRSPSATGVSPPAEVKK